MRTLEMMLCKLRRLVAEFYPFTGLANIKIAVLSRGRRCPFPAFGGAFHLADLEFDAPDADALALSPRLYCTRSPFLSAPSVQPRQ